MITQKKFNKYFYLSVINLDLKLFNNGDRNAGESVFSNQSGAVVARFEMRMNSSVNFD